MSRPPAVLQKQGIQGFDANVPVNTYVRLPLDALMELGRDRFDALFERWDVEDRAKAKAEAEAKASTKH